MTIDTWVATRPLADGDRFLIQASAGTGKTYQTEGLVVRMVAEHGKDITRILVITFTRAATAELRKRLRDRLVKARHALKTGDAQDDEVLELLLDLPSRDEALQNVERALRDFDQAPVSTIHSFCQRTLEQLSLAAAVDPSLSLLGEPKELREQIVSDTLARLYDQASVRQVAILRDMGWSRETLTAIVKDMTGPEKPVVEPHRTFDSSPEEWAVAHARRWEESLQALQDWLAGTEGQAAVQGYHDEPKQKVNKKKRLPYLNLDALKALDEWTAKGGLRGARLENGAMDWLTHDKIEHYWKEEAGDLAVEFPGYPLVRRFAELAARQDKLWHGALSPYADAVRDRHEAELTRMGVISYDSMLSMLDEHLESDNALAQAMRDQYDVAIVDEFQDTDGAQWGILEKVFLAEGKRLYVVGDPKQSIYRFRNANLAVYESAAALLTRERLPRNYRSDETLVKGLEYLWSGAREPFLNDTIAFEPVSAKHTASRVRALPEIDGRDWRPVELRWFDGEMTGGDAVDLPNKRDASDAIADLCAIECRQLIDSDAEICGETGTWSQVRASDLAVLVRTHDQGEAVRDALAAQGIPAIKTSQTDVLESEVVPWVLAWLDAVAAPGVESKARALALTPICGWSPRKLADALADPEVSGDGKYPHEEDRKQWAILLADIGTWAHNWIRQGFARVFDAALDQYDTLQRVLGRVHGERAATDLRHVFELLHAEERRSHAGPRVLAEWLLTQKIEQSDHDSDHVQRLESDADAVKIETIHGSKGLQYPIVLVPYGWTSWDPDDKGLPVKYSRVHDETIQLVLDLNLRGTQERTDAWETAQGEDAQESMRLLYVAMTRARHTLVMWMGAHDGSETSPAGRLLFQRTASADTPEFKPVNPQLRQAEKIEAAKEAISETLDEAVERLQALCDDSGGRVGLSLCGTPEPVSDASSDGEAADSPAPPGPLLRWDRDRHMGANWLLASFSSMAAGKASKDDEPAARSGALAGSSEDDETAAEVRVELAPDELDPTRFGASLHTAAVGHDLPGGKATGNWLHAIFEHLDFQAGTQSLDGRPVDELIGTLATRHGVRAPKWHARVEALMPDWLATPLDAPFPSGPGLTPGFTLARLPLEDRLDELRFDMRLGDGAHWMSGNYCPGNYQGRVDPSAVRHVLEDALKEPSFGGQEWLAELLQRTAAPEEGEEARRIIPAVAGFLSGFVDLCFRVRGDGDRYFVCDYKSNVLNGPENVREWHRKLPVGAGQTRPRLRRAHYTRPMLGWGMGHAAYHLQALVYTVALHRLLTVRLGEDYDYDTHVGGHLYLFLRGMEGSDPPRYEEAPLGVWADRWPARTVVGLDRALAGDGTEDVTTAMDAVSGGGR